MKPGDGRFPWVQARYVARTGTGHTPSRSRPELWKSDECTTPWFTLADVWQLRSDSRMVVTETSERISDRGITNSAAALHPAGTVLLSRTASVGFSAVMGCDMAVSQDFMTWTPGPRLDSAFLVWTLRGMRDHLRGLMYGSTHKTIYMPDLLSLRVPLPPLGEQRRIAAFLETESRRIDRLVDHLRAFSAGAVEAFEHELRNAIGGSDHRDRVDVPGAEWFKDMPSSWRAPNLGRIAQFVNGFAFKPEHWGSEGLPIIRIEHLNGAPLVHRTDHIADERHRVATGDLLFAWSGNRGTSFGPHMWSGEPALLNQHIFRVVTAEDARWVYWALRAATLYVEELAHGIIGMVHITKGRLTKIRVPRPPHLEQRRIAAHLDAREASLNELRTRIDTMVQRLETYRQALIQEAVTGVLSVSGVPADRLTEAMV